MDESRPAVNSPPIPGIRRASTLPSSPSNPSPTSSPQGQQPRTQQIETLFTHPNVRVLHFLAPSRGNQASQNYPTHPYDLYDSDEIQGTLPWRTSTERLVAAGPLRIHRVPGSVAFLNVGTSFLKPILAKSQCWCVDGISQFVLKRGPYDFYRIELPGETDTERIEADEFGVVLDEILRYEKTPCPFTRGFHVDLPESPQVTYVPWKPKHQPVSIPPNDVRDIITHDDFLTPSRTRQTTSSFVPVSSLMEMEADRYRSSSLGKPDVPSEDSILRDPIRPMIGRFEGIDKDHERDTLLARTLSKEAGMKQREEASQETTESNSFVEMDGSLSEHVEIEQLRDTSRTGDSLSISSQAFQRHIPRIDAHLPTANTRAASLAKHMQTVRMRPEQQVDDDGEVEKGEDTGNFLGVQRQLSTHRIGTAVNYPDKQIEHGTEISPSLSASGLAEVSLQVGASEYREQNLEVKQVCRNLQESSPQTANVASEMMGSLSASGDLSQEKQTRVSAPTATHIEGEEQSADSRFEYDHRGRFSFASSVPDIPWLANIQNSDNNERKIDKHQITTSSDSANMSSVAESHTNILFGRKAGSQNTQSLQRSGSFSSAVQRQRNRKSGLASLDQPGETRKSSSEEDPPTPFRHSFVESPSTPMIESYESEKSGSFVPSTLGAATDKMPKASSLLLHSKWKECLEETDALERSPIDTDTSQTGMQFDSSLSVHHRSQFFPQSYEQLGAVIGKKMAGMVLGPPLRLAALMLHIASSFSEGARIKDESGTGWKRRSESGRKLPGTWQYSSEDQATEDDDGEEDYGIDDFGFETECTVKT